MARRGARRSTFESPTEKGFMFEMHKQFKQAVKIQDRKQIEVLRPLVR